MSEINNLKRELNQVKSNIERKINNKRAATMSGENTNNINRELQNLQNRRNQLKIEIDEESKKFIQTGTEVVNTPINNLSQQLQIKPGKLNQSKINNLGKLIAEKPLNTKNIGSHVKKQKVISDINSNNKQKIEGYESDQSLITSSYDELSKDFEEFKTNIISFNKNLLDISSIELNDDIIPSFKLYIESKYELYTNYSTQVATNMEQLNTELNSKISSLSELQTEVENINTKYKSQGSTSSTRKLGSALESRYFDLIEKVEVERDNLSELNGLYTQLEKSLKNIKLNQFSKLFGIIYDKILSYYKTKLDTNTSKIKFNGIQDLTNAELIPKLYEYNNQIKLCIVYINKFFENISTISNTYKVENFNTNNVITDLRGKLGELDNNITIFINAYKGRITGRLNKSFDEIKVLQEEVIECIHKFFTNSKNNINSLGKLRSNLITFKTQSNNLFGTTYVESASRKLSKLHNTNLQSIQKQINQILTGIINNVNSGYPIKTENLLESNENNNASLTSAETFIPETPETAVGYGNQTNNTKTTGTNNTKTTGTNEQYPGLLNNYNSNFTRSTFQVGEIVRGETTNGKSVTGPLSNYVPGIGLRTIVKNGKNIPVLASSIQVTNNNGSSVVSNNESNNGSNNGSGVVSNNGSSVLSNNGSNNGSGVVNNNLRNSGLPGFRLGNKVQVEYSPGNIKHGTLEYNNNGKLRLRNNVTNNLKSLGPPQNRISKVKHSQ